MRNHLLVTTALLFALPVTCSFAAEEVAPDRAQETVNLTPITDANNPAESRTVPDNLQATRKVDELPFSDIKILPSF